jgi:hypothetical protein
MRNQLFHGTGNGRFVETTDSAGAELARPDVGRGAAFGDIDNDGDIDILVTTNGGPVKLFRNDTASGHHWLQVRLQQRPANRFGLGAWVGVERTGQPTLWRRVRSDGSYLSASDARAHYGLGPSPAITGAVVKWPDGVEERFTGIAADRIVTLERGAGRAGR